MESLFVDFNKRKYNRIFYPLVAVVLAGDGVYQLLQAGAGNHPTIPIIEIIYGIVLVTFWAYPPKWYFRVDDAAIEYKGQFMRLRRFAWTGMKSVRLLPAKIAMTFEDGKSHNILLSFLGPKERSTIKEAVGKFATERNLLQEI